MATRVDYHTETAIEFLAKAHEYLAGGDLLQASEKGAMVVEVRGNLAGGDLLQASEKGWGATARMVKAVAESRGWRHSSHGDLYRVIDRLVEETSDEQLQNLFRSASTLHQNFYEGWMATDVVADALKDVEEITKRLSAALS